jgi:hypothetical protein
VNAVERALAFAALATLAACVARDTVATAAVPDREAFCRGAGPPILLDGSCTGALAAAAFSRAVCACGALSLGSDLRTDGFDSRAAPWVAGGAGGDLGANGGLDFAGTVDVGGSLTIAGAGVQAGERLRVRGDLEIAGGLGRPSTQASVGGAARIGGDIDVGALDVAGTLTTPAGAIERGAITAGARTLATVAVPAPCRCGVGERIDVAGIVEEYRLSNHNAAIGLASSALADVRGDTSLELPCGLFFLDRIQATGSAVVLRATGRTAVFVAGGITIDGALAVQVAEGAELDLFVAGFLNLPVSVSLGDPLRPRALRIWAGSGGAINLGGSALSGSLYAPNADLSANAPLEVFGAVFVDHLAIHAGMTIHYDRAIASAGGACQR